MYNSNGFDQIIDEVRITEVAGSIGLNINKNKALCIFHDETEASLTFYPATNSFYCFGCGVGGTVIDLYKRYHDCDSLTAAQQLAEGYNIPWQYDESTEDRIKRKEEEMLQKFLSEMVQRWHSQLREEDVEHLKKRGLSDDLINTLQIGYEPEESPADTDAAKKLGLVSDNGQYLAAKSIIIPLRNYGRIVLPVFYRPDQNPKYLLPAGRSKPLIGADIISRQNELFLAEGVFDYLSLLNAGFKALCSCGVRLNEGQKNELTRAPRVFIAFDGDEAGRTAGLELCCQLFPKGRMLEIPEGKDINDLLTENPQKFNTVIQDLRKNSKDSLCYEVERIAVLPEWERLGALKEKVCPLLAKQDEIEQKQFFDKHKNLFGFKKEKLFHELMNQYVKASVLAEDQETEVRQMTPEEVCQAEELLASSDILERFIEATEKLGHVGEVINKKYLFLALTSRKLNRPISTVIKGESSSGKSHLVDTVTDFFPEEDIYQYTRLTANVLYYTKRNFSNKVLVIMEGSGSEESDYTIRSFISEGSLRISCTIKDPQTGEFREMDRTVAGPIAYIETTTKSAIHNENQTRVFDIFADESEVQTKCIIEAEKIRAQGGGISVAGEKVITQPFINSQALLESYKVIIPYAGVIDFPTARVRIRRDFKRFLSLIEASAILYQRQRVKVEKDGETYIIAEIDDYRTAYEIAQTILIQTLKNISPKAEIVASAAERFFATKANYSEEKATRKDFYELLPDMSPSSVDRYLDELVNIGFLERVGGGQGRGNAIVYHPLKSLEEIDLLIPSPEVIEAKINNLKDVS